MASACCRRSMRSPRPQRRQLPRPDRAHRPDRRTGRVRHGARGDAARAPPRAGHGRVRDPRPCATSSSMRELAAAAGIPCRSSRASCTTTSRRYLERTAGPWLLKPRTQASAIGIRKLHRPDELWPILDELGDMQSHHLLERFVPGDVYHVDGLVDRRRAASSPRSPLRGAALRRHARRRHLLQPTVPRGGEEEAALRAMPLASCARSRGLDDGAFHAEFIRATRHRRLHFLEIAARVGGAHIADMVQAATGVNLWREWARSSWPAPRGAPYRRPARPPSTAASSSRWPGRSGPTRRPTTTRGRLAPAASATTPASSWHPRRGRASGSCSTIPAPVPPRLLRILPAPDRATN
jgi:hypothetical protein